MAQSTSPTRLPGLGKNPLQEAFEDFQFMKDELASVRSELVATKDHAVALGTENEQLRRAQSHAKEHYEAEVATLRKERDMYMRYSMDLTTRLKVIKENIIETEKAAQIYAARPTPEGMTVRADEANGVATEESRSARQIIERMPRAVYPR